MPDHFFISAVIQIIGIDILLSGDNAVVIAMVCQSLPSTQRKIGITLGIGLAMIFRIIVAAGISFILFIPFLKSVGGLFLLYIAVKVIRSEEEENQTYKRPTKLLTAVAMIAIADITMSLDNVIAIVGIANGNDLIFFIGLLISMPLMIIGASLITTIINRFPIIIWVGGGLLGWIGGGMIRSDPYMPQISSDWVISSIGVIIVVAISLIMRTPKFAKA